ncbi:DinB family protein [Meiothermus sp.]|uniref:DinB family protein n=1 Tax=Meiothermus sp. TaxID=1955249 RepID=UPI00307F1EC1
MYDSVLGALLDSFQRNNTILLNLLRALPEGGMDARAIEGSQSVGVQFSHVQNTRLFWLEQVAPEFWEGQTQLFSKDGDNWIAERDPQRIEEALRASAQAVCDAVKGRLETGQPMKGEHASYDHPVLFLQHMLWHEGYHFGQIKLALKAAGHVWSDEQEEKVVWSLWRTEVW